VGRDQPQITMNIKRRTRARIMGRDTLLARGAQILVAPRHAAQNKARRGLPPGHTNSVSISPILRFEGGVNAGADVEGVEPNLHARTRHNAR